MYLAWKGNKSKVIEHWEEKAFGLFVLWWGFRLTQPVKGAFVCKAKKQQEIRPPILSERSCFQIILFLQTGYFFICGVGEPQEFQQTGQSLCASNARNQILLGAAVLVVLKL